MACCNYTIQPFALQSTTTVPYVGDRPTIDVVYLQTDGTFLQMGVFTQINFTTTDVIINHGGPASVLVKILQ